MTNPQANSQTNSAKSIDEVLKNLGSKLSQTEIQEIKTAFKQNRQPNSVDFRVNGAKVLSGSIQTNCSKNGAMGLLCASLLNHGTTILHGIPKIEEVSRIIEVLRSIDIKITWIDTNSIEIIRPKVLSLEKIEKVSASKTRTILMFLGPLIHEYDNFTLPHSQGCTLGTRTITPHLYGLEEFGVQIKVTDNEYQVKSNLKTGSDVEIIMYESSDTGAELLLMAAAKYPGKTTIKYVSSNYMVQDVCYFLQSLGVVIDGIGTQTLIIQGKAEINLNAVHYNSEDPIESMMFISAAIVTNSQITIERCPINFLELELLKLTKMGFKYSISNKQKAKNGFTNLVDITTYPSALTALPDKITCGAYPDINMDNLPFFVPIACVASGQTLIHDWVYENRAIYFVELSRLGCNITLADPHRVFIKGGTGFKPAQVVCPPALRPAMIILIGMLGADGVSVLRNVYSIKRGYEDIAERLNTLGADIEVI